MTHDQFTVLRLKRALAQTRRSVDTLVVSMARAANQLEKDGYNELSEKITDAVEILQQVDNQFFIANLQLPEPLRTEPY